MNALRIFLFFILTWLFFLPVSASDVSEEVKHDEPTRLEKIIEAVTKSYQAHEKRKSGKALYLKQDEAPDVVLYGANVAGKWRDFQWTGAANTSFYDKNPILFTTSAMGCRECSPSGTNLTIDLTGYFGQGPVWCAIRNLGSGHVTHSHRAPGELFPVKISQVAYFSPEFVLGVTAGGSWGALDASLSFEDANLRIYGGGVTKMFHSRFSGRVYSYSQPLHLGPLSVRLFGGCEGVLNIDGEPDAWGIRVAPGAEIEGMIGVQCVLSSVRFGIGFGRGVVGATTYSGLDTPQFKEKEQAFNQQRLQQMQQVEDARVQRQDLHENAYGSRDSLERYLQGPQKGFASASPRHYTEADLAPIFAPEPSVKTDTISGYMSYRFNKVVVGLSLCATQETNRSTGSTQMRPGGSVVLGMSV